MKANKLRQFRHGLEGTQWAMVNLRQCRKYGGCWKYAESRKLYLDTAMKWRELINAITPG
jgi:hypothetical protein